MTRDTPTSLTDPAAASESAEGLDQTERVILRALAEESGEIGEADLLLVEGDESGRLNAWAARQDAPSWSATTSARRARELGARSPQELLDVTADGSATSQAPARLLVVMRLPRSLAELRARSAEIAIIGRRLGAAEVILAAGGRTKHMTRAQNEVLAEVFESVHASRGLGKSRALVGRLRLEASSRDGAEERALLALREQSGSVRIPVLEAEQEVPLRGVGGVFSGARADAGGLLLLTALDAHLASLGAQERARYADVVDLGCGNGLLSAHLALALPAARIRASDDDADAVESAAGTLAATGAGESGRIEVVWEDSLRGAEAGGADLVVLNPPFHDGSAIDATLAHELLDAAARVLRPGGELWFVHNSHLRHRTEVERRVGPVEQRARDPRFTVLRAVRS